MGPLDLPLLPAEPLADERVILIAHSAGGWMSRIYLSEARWARRQRAVLSLLLLSYDTTVLVLRLWKRLFYFMRLVLGVYPIACRFSLEEPRVTLLAHTCSNPHAWLAIAAVRCALDWQLRRSDIQRFQLSQRACDSWHAARPPRG